MAQNKVQSFDTHFEDLKIYGDISAVEKYINFGISDVDDYFHLTREDTSILGFKIEMPLLIDTSAVLSFMGTGFVATAGISSNITEADDLFTGTNGEISLAMGMNMSMNRSGDIDNYGTDCLDATLSHRFYQSSGATYKGANDIIVWNGGVYGGVSDDTDINASGKRLISGNTGFYSDCLIGAHSTAGTHDAYNILLTGILESKDHNVTTGTVRNIMLYAYDNVDLGKLFLPKVGDENYVILNESIYPITMRNDNSKIQFGLADDFEMYWNGTNQVLDPTKVSEGGVQIIVGAETNFLTENLVIDLSSFYPTLELQIPIINGTSYSNLPGILPLPYCTGVYNNLAVIDNSNSNYAGIIFSKPDFTLNCGLEADFTNQWIDVNWDFVSLDDGLYDNGKITQRWKDGHFANDVVLSSDTGKIKLGGGSDMTIWYDGTYGQIKTSDVAASDLKITTGSNKTIELQNVVYDDVRINIGNISRPGSSDPAWVSYQPGGSGTATYLLEFSKNNYGTFTVQLPHGYKQGTNIKVHLHWTPGANGATENGNTVGWKVLYSWANINGTFGTLSTADLSDACDGTDHKHQMTPDVSITGTSKNISSMLMCNVIRTDTGTDDTWSGTASGSLPMLLEVDFHFEIDTIGSRDWGTK